MEVGRLPILRHEGGAAALDRIDGGLGQRRGIDIPLVGEARLDHGIGAVAVGHGVGVRLDLLDQALGFEALDDHLARGEAEHAVQFENRRLEFRARLDILDEVGIGIEQELSFGA